jgi:hypothetical protein
MRNAKISLLVALLAGLVTVMLINEIGISRYPPAGRFADGMTPEVLSLFAFLHGRPRARRDWRPDQSVALVSLRDDTCANAGSGSVRSALFEPFGHLEK